MERLMNIKRKSVLAMVAVFRVAFTAGCATMASRESTFLGPHANNL